MNSMNWDGLRYFIAAADAGSLSAAAIQLGSNQPTVGRHIDTLESELGIKLFQRSVRGLSLTQEGQYIYEQSKHIQNSIVKIQRSIQGDKDTVSGTVTLSVPEGIGQEILIPALSGFYHKYPHIDLIINVSASSANLTLGEAELAIRLYRPEESNLVVKRLGEMKLGLFASAKYDERHALPVTEKDLYTHRVIAYGDQLANLPENQWLLKYIDKSLRILSSDSTISRLNATRAGIGISIQPLIIAQNKPDLLQILHGAKVPSHNAWLAYHKDFRQVARIRAVIDFVSNLLITAFSTNKTLPTK